MRPSLLTVALLSLGFALLARAPEADRDRSWAHSQPSWTYVRHLCGFIFYVTSHFSRIGIALPPPGSPSSAPLGAKPFFCSPSAHPLSRTDFSLASTDRVVLKSPVTTLPNQWSLLGPLVAAVPPTHTPTSKGRKAASEPRCLAGLLLSGGLTEGLEPAPSSSPAQQTGAPAASRGASPSSWPPCSRVAPAPDPTQQALFKVQYPSHQRPPTSRLPPLAGLPASPGPSSPCPPDARVTS